MTRRHEWPEQLNPDTELAPYPAPPNYETVARSPAFNTHAYKGVAYRTHGRRFRGREPSVACYPAPIWAARDRSRGAVITKLRINTFQVSRSCRTVVKYERTLADCKIRSRHNSGAAGLCAFAKSAPKDTDPIGLGLPRSVEAGRFAWHMAVFCGRHALDRC